jgi:hypothetical protein
MCLGIQSIWLVIKMSTSAETNAAIQRIHKSFQGLQTNENREKSRSFVPRSTDVFVVTPLKSGTTWVQQIMHQLRSGGDMSFTDIEEVVPWIELAYDVKQDLNAEHKYQPRCFKTHLWYDVCPKGAKYILVYREPCATFYSLFNFFQGKHFLLGELTLDEFVKNICLLESNKMQVNYFDHLLSWWPKRNDPNVLCLLYEDMLEDLDSAVRAVASFIGVEDESSIANAVKMSTFDFMKENQDKFATHLVSRHRDIAMGLPEETVLQRVVTGSATKGREMMEECTKKAVQEMWNETVTKETGIQNYNEFRSAFKKQK